VPAPARHAEVFEQDGSIYFQPDEDRPPVRISASQDRFYAPELSPDGEKVLYLGRETGIYIADVEGRTAVSVGRGAHPEWLPDSSGIVYDIFEGQGDSAVDGDLWFASADGRERTNLTATADIAEAYPAVSTDGRRVAFSSDGAIYVGDFIRNPSAR
jgi:Tol biopolymer transport system component